MRGCAAADIPYRARCLAFIAALAADVKKAVCGAVVAPQAGYYNTLTAGYLPHGEGVRRSTPTATDRLSGPRECEQL
jgi:hypothetical protein